MLSGGGVGPGLVGRVGAVTYLVCCLVMDRTDLLSELDRLLGLGEPLLTWFPEDGWGEPELPDRISSEMRRYAGFVFWRAGRGAQYRDLRRHGSIAGLKAKVKDCARGLLGWRAVGVL